jgi:Uma2 family endonuclease
MMPDPVLLIEVISPANEAETWANVWAYTTIPSVQEIWIVHSTQVLAEILRRHPDGSWPEQPEQVVTGGELRCERISFAAPLNLAYVGSGLAP